jgi:putative DNA primase/helicase
MQQQYANPPQNANVFDISTAHHVVAIHRLAAASGMRGKLILAGYGEGLRPAVYHFAVGDVGALVAGVRQVILAHSDEPRNWYMPLAIMRPDLEPGLKGGESDIVAVLGAVIDCDADKGGDAPRSPVEANCVLETSPGNQQQFLAFDRPLPLGEAKPLLVALQRMTGADCASDASHVWRMPGCLNWPTAAKLKPPRNRPAEPAAVRVIQPWNGSTTSVAALREVLAPHMQEPQPETAAAAAGEYDVCPVKAEAFLVRLKDAGYFDFSSGFKRERYVGATKACAHAASTGEHADKFRDMWERVVCWKGDRDDEGEAPSAEEMEERWRDCSRLQPGSKKRPKTFGSLIDDAKKVYGWTGINLRRDKTAAEMFGTAPAAAAANAAPEGVTLTPMTGGGGYVRTLLTPEYGETELAERFADKNHKELRYVKAWGTWLHWTGKRWQRDDSDFVADLVRKHCRRESALCAGTPNYTAAHARSLCSERMVNAVTRLARLDRRIAATPETWDQDHWLLGTPDGIIELRTGKLRPARPEDHVTKSTSVAPSGECPLWLAFLRRVTGGDAELQTYLQRVVGYALTGSTREHALFFAHGPGGSGKGTFMHAVESLLGEYHKATAIQTFTESQYDRHPAEIAALHGSRLVTCSETEKGRHWAESRVKELTGGDTISARFMAQNFFNFVPTFKILISGNYKPRMRPDAAMRRRFQLIPFIVEIPKGEIDQELGVKLQGELPGILAWAVQGCLAWQRDGLQPPTAVLDATTEYFEEESEDVLTMWLHECCDVDARATSTHSALYRSYKSYADQAGERPVSSLQFGKDLKRLKFESDRKNTARMIVGLKLKSQPAPSPQMPDIFQNRENPQ